MNKILIVDDESKIREIVKEYATLSGFNVDEASDGLKAIELVKLNDYDCIILDIMMPNIDGFTALKKIKELKDTPIIMLSARDQEYDKLFSFDNGVDDYVCKPFSPKELIARIKVLVSRNKQTNNNTIIEDGIKLEIEGRNLYIDDIKVNVTNKEFDLLMYLIRNKNTVINRDKLLESIWGYDYSGDDRTIDSHIKMLRKNLGKYRESIVTIRGLGYKFENKA